MKVGAKLIAVVAAAVFTAGIARADDASKREKLHEMFHLSHIDQLLNQMLDQQRTQLPKLMQRMMPNGTVSPEQQKDLDAFLLKLDGIVRQEASWEKMEPQFTDIYASVYSEQEVDGLIAFYKSPVGQEMVAKQPEIVAKSQTVTQAMFAAVQPQIMQAVIEFANQEKAKYPNAK